MIIKSFMMKKIKKEFLIKIFLNEYGKIKNFINGKIT